MPAITPIVATNATGSTTTSGTFVDASCTTTALANGVDYLVLVLSSHSNEGAFPATSGSEMEARFGTTRYAASSFVGAFGNFNAGDTANGGILQAAFHVTGDGSSTINLRVRRVGGSDTVRWGSSQVIAIPLTALTINVDYWLAESANSDTAELTAAGATFTDGASGGALSLTPATSGDYALIYSAEGFISGTIGTQETFRARTRMDSTTIGTETETQLDVDAALSAAFGPSFFSIDVRTLTASTPYVFRWQFANDVSGLACAYRRSRVFAIRLDAFTAAASIANGGDIVANNGTVDAANALSFNFGTSIPTLILASCAHQNGGAFGQGYLRDGTTNYPADGYMWAVLNGGTGPGDDNGWLSFATVQALTGAQSWLLRGHSDGASDLTYGRDVGNTTASRAVVLAIHLESAGSSTEYAEAEGSIALGGSLSATPRARASAAGAIGLAGILTAAPGPVYASVAGFIGLDGRLSSPSAPVDGDDVSLRPVSVEALAPSDLSPFALEILPL